MRRFAIPFCVVSVLVPMVLAIGGCGTSALSGPTGTVVGKVTYNGAPVPAGCTVTFIHQETSTPASGVTGADGGYSLTMRGEQKTLAGEYKVSVGPPGTGDQVDATNEQDYQAVMLKGEQADVANAPFPDKFFLPATSGLSYTVNEGPNTIDVELKD